MKRTLILLFASIGLYSFAQNDFCDDYSDPNRWTQVGTNVVVQNNRLEFMNGCSNGQQRRVFQQLPTPLSTNMNWEAKVLFHPDDYGIYQGRDFTGHVLMSFTAGDKEMFSDCVDIPCSPPPHGTQDAITLSAVTPNPPDGNVYFFLYVKDGQAEAQTGFTLRVPQPGIDYHVQLNKSNQTQLTLQVYYDSLHQNPIPGSPLTFNEPSINNLQPLSHVQQGAVARGFWRREMNGYLDDFCLNYLIKQDSSVYLCQYDSVLLQSTNQPFDKWYLGSDPSTIISTAPSIWALPTMDSIYIGENSSEKIVFNLKTQEVIFDFTDSLALCNGDNIDLSTNIQSTGQTFSWSTGSNASTINVSSPGTYSLTVTDSIGCNHTDSIFIDFDDSVSIDIGPDVLLCDEESYIIDIDSSSNGSILWSTGGNNSTIEVTTSGTYWVSITSGICPSVTDSIQVDFFTSPDMIEDPEDLCPDLGYAVSMEGFDGTVIWEDGNTELSRVFYETTLMLAQFTHNNGCVFQDILDLTIHELPNIDLGPDTVICDDDDLTLKVFCNNCTYQWNNNPINLAPNYVVSTSGLHTLEVIDENGCLSSFEREVLFESCEPLLLMPNIFSPNGDGINDLLTPVESKNISKMHTRILNRWGETIFETTDLKINWTGENLNEGTYFYLIEYQAEEGTPKQAQGTIRVKR